MNLILRLLTIALASFRRPRLGLLDESVVRLTVLPTDLDVNGHMNNGRYLTVMDLGRVDLFLRTGIVAGMRRHRWSGVVASVTVRFRRALDPFARYELRSRLLCWDERWVFMEQRFTRRGELCAYGLVKIQFSGRGGRIHPQEMMYAVAPGTDAPAVPQAVRDWMDSEERLVSGERREAAVPA